MNIKLWFLIHKWTSLICTLFLLLLCITGLPLIFHEEIEHYIEGVIEAPPMPSDTPMASLDRIAHVALTQQPDQVIRYMIWDDDHHPNLTFVSMSSAVDAPPDDFHLITVDSRTAAILDETNETGGFMDIMFRLHVDMFAGLPGTLFLGFMGLLFVAAIVSGVVLYAPFMRKLDFGTVRTQRSTRLKWLDLHNLLGIVTLVWALVVGLTGSINTLSQIVLAVWQNDQVAEMIAPYAGQAAPSQLGPVQPAIDAAREAVPEMDASFIAWPGTVFSSEHHYAVFMKGTTPLTSRLLQPVLVDAVSGEMTDTRTMPWYVQTLLLSQPLHFGDYGGLPLKILWALLDIATIYVLGTGLYLWLGRRRTSLSRHITEIETGGMVEGNAS